MTEIKLPMTEEQARSLRAGDAVRISGVIYTARDAAHKRLCAMIEAGEELPIELRDAVIYYAGPCPAGPGRVIGSCGPTTSGRMDAYAPAIYAHGARAAIGKGVIADGVKDAMKKYGGVYFVAVGGAGALIARCVKSAQEVAFKDLGPESIKRLEVADMPLIVGADSFGGDIYEMRGERA